MELVTDLYSNQNITAHNSLLIHDPSTIAYPRDNLPHMHYGRLGIPLCLHGVMPYAHTSGWRAHSAATSYIYVSTLAGTWVITLPQMLLLT